MVFTSKLIWDNSIYVIRVAKHKNTLTHSKSK